MKAFFKAVFVFLTSPLNRRCLLLYCLMFAALFDFFSLGLARRTFVFYNVDNGVIAVEDRMLKYLPSKEDNIIRYTEETLLGPVSPNLLPLFPRETRLKSLMYRDKTVYIDFTESAALPPFESIKGTKIDSNADIAGMNIYGNFRTLYDSILRNFSYVKDVRFFIEGNIVILEAEKRYNIEEETADLEFFSET